ncbi:MAG: hypothetical protein NVSMB66_3780 [Candidatus Doudnabacteria bacterium]
MQIKSLEGKRWFIWTLVLLAVAGVALVTFIMTSGDDDSSGTTLRHRIKSQIKQVVPIKHN